MRKKSLHVCKEGYVHSQFHFQRFQWSEEYALRL